MISVASTVAGGQGGPSILGPLTPGGLIDIVRKFQKPRPIQNNGPSTFAGKNPDGTPIEGYGDPVYDDQGNLLGYQGDVNNPIRDNTGQIVSIGGLMPGESLGIPNGTNGAPNATGAAGGGNTGVTNPFDGNTKSDWLKFGVKTGLDFLNAWRESEAAKKASEAQAAAADNAAALQDQAGKDALQFQKDVWEKQQVDAQPWIDAGTGALKSIGDISQEPGWGKEFKAPSAQDVANSPAVQLRLKAGQQAIERSAAAGGRLQSGGTLKAISQYGQDIASEEYGNEWTRQDSEYKTAYNTFANERAARLDPLYRMAGYGNATAGQLQTTGTNNANLNANTTLTTASRVGDQLTDAAGARASGYVGGSNAWRRAFSELGNSVIKMV